MKVDINKIEIKNNQINKNIKDYEDVILNYYNELKIMETNWKDGNSLSFFESIEETKKDIMKNTNELKKIKNIYHFLVEQYKKFGNVINIEFSNTDEVTKKINNITSMLEKTYQKYIDLDFSNVDYNIRNILIAQKEIINTVKENLEEVKEKEKNTVGDIKEIETKIANKINKIDTEYVSDEIYSDVVRNIDSIYMNIDEVEASIKKLEMYKRDEDLLVEDIENNIKDIGHYYISDNKDTLQDIQSILFMNLNKIKEIHEANILKIMKHKDSYIENSKRTKKAFEELGDIK